MSLPYPAAVWALFQAAPGAGRLDPRPGVARGRGGRRRDGGEVEVWLALTGREVREARFLAWGCPWTIALAAAVVAGLRGRRLPELAEFRADAAAIELGLPPERLGVKIWIEDAVRAAARAALEDGEA